jgi:hypothetical protein
MTDDDAFGTDPLDIIHELLETERSFYDIVHMLDPVTRNIVVESRMRNSASILGLLRIRMNVPPPTRMILNFPLNLDSSGNFLDGVPVVPTSAQIANAVEQNVHVTETQCSICQESVQSASRIRYCGHCFHHECISQWFLVNPRCPMCRHDVRDLHRNSVDVPNEDNRMHPDEES